jgi:hypothetical protein
MSFGVSVDGALAAAAMLDGARGAVSSSKRVRSSNTVYLLIFIIFKKIH